MIESLGYIDWFSLTLIFAFGISGFFNGLIKEVFSAASWIFSLALAWLYGPILFPYIETYVDSVTLKNILSFVLLFLGSFIVLKFVGSILSGFISAIGLRIIDRLFGAFFGAVKILAVLSSLYIFNLNSLDKSQWWLDSYSRIYAIDFYNYSKPIFDEWIDRADQILDKDNNKINNLKKGIIPIYEPGLEELVLKNYKNKRLNFSTNLKETVKKSDIVFVCVGTPTKRNSNSADLSQVYSVAKEISKSINKFKIIHVSRIYIDGSCSNLSFYCRSYCFTYTSKAT